MINVLSKIVIYYNDFLEIEGFKEHVIKNKGLVLIDKYWIIFMDQ